MSSTAKHRLVLAVCLLVLVAVATVTAACGGSASGSGDVALTVVGAGGTKDYTLDQLKDMSSTEGYAGIKSSTGRITPPVVMKGVLFEELFKEVGGLADDAAVGIVAKDGYEMTMSVSQLKAGDFITYDMVTGAEIKVDEPVQVIIAYEYDGKPIDPQTEGPLRLAIISKKQNQVTDGHWSVKWVNKVQMKTIEQEWSLMLKGFLTEEIDRATFESGSASGCHREEWTDADGNRWSGIPLYLLIGRVDDDAQHNGPAYNRDLAEAGYQVKITSAGGQTVEMASTAMYYKRDVLVAFELNGKPLPEEYWPLRLVGAEVQQSDMIGQISEIEALLPPQ
jgi:DMSO/TMAO reductase YedYZ molybdopterin-dependent catalytic subunit